jgi:signal transduction histidine kinase/ActR/RegA family two-component response regulator
MEQAVEPGAPINDEVPHQRSHDRQYLCIASPPADKTGSILHSGDQGFIEQVSRYYPQLEAAALEQLGLLKEQLRHTKGDKFWTAATEGLAQLLGAEYAFISKRMFVDLENPNIALPPLGDKDSCLLGMSIYYAGGENTESFNALRAKYVGYNCPCAYMKHDKTLLIPKNLSQLLPNNPNPLPESPEGYLAVPLSYWSEKTHSTVTFGHFGVMWTEAGVANRRLSFAFLESLMHGVQDVIGNQFVEQRLINDSEQVLKDDVPERRAPTANVFTRAESTQEPATPSYSLKSFARSLSHELRTPMQGVVGMLDVMFAQVQTASEHHLDPTLHEMFLSLKEGIEIVQDSARRAVEAADNIVHAYDMDMSVPDGPPADSNDEIDGLEETQLTVPLPPTPNESVSPRRRHKRPFSSLEIPDTQEHPSKIRRSETNDEFNKQTPPSPHDSVAPCSTVEGLIAPGIRLTNVRQTLQEIINDVLNIGRPNAKIALPIDGGEEIEVRRHNSGFPQENVQNVKWTVDPVVPETIMTDEKDFVGLISRILHNAVKFTETGLINITVRLSTRARSLVIAIEDSGPGIPLSFMPKLFKAFSKEDDSLTRASEGLGLGLMVAKGLARKLRGDILVVRSATEGPKRGTEFQIRIPIVSGDNSRPHSPFGSPSPSRRSLHSNQSSSQSPHRATPPVGHHSRTCSGASKMEAPTSDAMPPPTPPISESPAASYIRSTRPVSTIIPQILRMDEISASKLSKLSIRLPRSFLVVEDNVVLRKILVRMLKDFGYTNIIEAHDGAHAVKQAEKHLDRLRKGEVAFNIDVVLMDLWMPRMNGYEAFKRIQAMFQDHPPVVLAVTADVTDEATMKVVNSGMKGPLTKPYKMKDLERNLLEFC